MEYNQSPYKEIPEELIQLYSNNHEIPILLWWLDDSKKNRVQWNNEYIQKFIDSYSLINIIENKEGWSPYGHMVVLNLMTAFKEYNIENQTIAVIGSETPWIEAMLYNLNNKITTIEYNVPECSYDKIICKSYFDYFEKTSEATFDSIVTFSSIEHSGLGRYGDPLDPDGDIKTMKTIHKNLKKGGYLIWGAPVGEDAVVWNAHRIYGKKRLRLMFEGFKEIEWININKEELLEVPLYSNAYQPVIVLKKL